MSRNTIDPDAPSKLAATVLVAWLKRRLGAASSALSAAALNNALPLEHLPRTPGAAVFLSSTGEIDRGAFLGFVAAEKSLAQQVLLVRHRVAWVPHVPLARQARITPLLDGVQLAAIRFGFNDAPDLPRALAAVHALPPGPPAARYYVSPEPLEAIARSGWPAWRRRLFLWMLRWSVPMAEHLNLPAERTVVLRASAQDQHTQR